MDAGPGFLDSWKAIANVLPGRQHECVVISCPDDQFDIGHADGCTELEPFRMSARLEPRIGNCKDIRVYARRRMRFSERWRRADHNFAVATIALMIFFLVVGFAAWVLDEKPSVAGVSAPAHGFQARSMP